MSRRVYVLVSMVCAVFSVGAFDLVRDGQAQAVAASACLKSPCWPGLAT